MPIKFKCACGKLLLVPDEAVGKQAKCPNCNVVSTIPDPEEAELEVELLDNGEQDEEEAGVGEAPPAVSRMPCVVIIDDDPDLSLTLADMLRKEDYRVEWARTLEEGMEKIARYRPDIVVLDILLPDGDGFEAAQRLKAAGAAAPAIIALTPRMDDAAEERAEKMGLAGHMRKPLYPGALCQMVVDLMEELRD